MEVYRAYASASFDVPAGGATVTVATQIGLRVKRLSWVSNAFVGPPTGGNVIFHTRPNPNLELYDDKITISQITPETNVDLLTSGYVSFFPGSGGGDPGGRLTYYWMSA